MQVGSVIRRRVTNRGGTREERGRLKTQDYTRLRDSINGMYKASRAREAQLIDLFLADTLDVDDFLRLKNRNANAPKVAYQVCIDHERTWDKEPVGIKFRDRIEVNGPRVDEPWVQWTAAKFEGKVGVSPTQFLQICEQHKLIPLKIEGKNRSACTREFGIFLVLRRFRLMEGSFRDLSIELNAHRTRLQYLYAATIILYEVHYTDLATKVDVFRLAQPGALERLAKASMDVGAPYSHIIAYIDGKPVFTTRPGNRACKHQALQYNGNDIDVQKLFYTGYSPQTFASRASRFCMLSSFAVSMEKRWSICRRYSTSMNLPIASYTCALFSLSTLQMQLCKLYYCRFAYISNAQTYLLQNV